MAGGGANSGVGSGLSTAAGAVYVLGGLALGETGSGAVQGAIAAAAAPAAIAGQCWRFVLVEGGKDWKTRRLLVMISRLAANLVCSFCFRVCCTAAPLQPTVED